MTDAIHDTYLKTLRLRNFRHFDEVAMEFHPNLTVLVAKNGGGKTALLDATAVSIQYFVDTIRAASTSHGFSNSDVRLARREGVMVSMTPTALESSAVIDGRRVTWRRELASVGGRTTRVEAEELADRAKRLLDALRDFADRRTEVRPTLPVIGYYGTGRLWSTHKLTENKKKAAEELALTTGAYLDCLSPSSSFSAFNAWFDRVVREAQVEQSTGTPSPHRPQELLAAVRGAVDVVLQPVGWHTLDWDFITDELVASHAAWGRLPVSLLSDGVRNLLALVADIAHRAARLNPHLGNEAAPQTPGIVLIDEVDMHLHPEWQQVVIGSLREAFPRVQFIVTTHSPQVLSTVPRECIRILEQTPEGGWEVRIPEEQTEGVASALVMAAVMGVDGTPDNEHVRRLREYGSLIADGQGAREDARALRGVLDQHFGAQSAVMLECDRVIRLEEMKRKMLRREGA